jgi:hypothetical protein
VHEHTYADTVVPWNLVSKVVRPCQRGEVGLASKRSLGSSRGFDCNEWSKIERAIFRLTGSSTHYAKVSYNNGLGVVLSRLRPRAVGSLYRT